MEKDGQSQSMSEVTYLKVRQAAKTTITSSKPETAKFHKVGSNYTVSCGVEGYPVDTSSAAIHFRPCASFDDCQLQCVNQSLRLKPVDGVTDEEYHFNFTGELAVPWQESGMVGCTACTLGTGVSSSLLYQGTHFSFKECSKAEVPYFFSETEMGFSVVRLSSGQEVVRGGERQGPRGGRGKKTRRDKRVVEGDMVELR